ncbi:hypothetical protein D3C84_475470 [compost metagenome]
MAINEDVVQWNVQGQAAQAKHHGRAGAAQTVTETAQYAIKSCGGKAAGNTVQVLHARADQLRVNLHDVQNGFGVQQCSRCQEPDQQCQPQRLSNQWTDFTVSAGPETLGDFGGSGQQGAGHQQKDRHPDRVAQGNRREVARTESAGHHRIDETHRRSSELRDHDR